MGEGGGYRLIDIVLGSGPEFLADFGRKFWATCFLLCLCWAVWGLPGLYVRVLGFGLIHLRETSDGLGRLV